MFITNNDCNVVQVPKDFLKCSTLESNKKRLLVTEKRYSLLHIDFRLEEQEVMEILENTGISFDTQLFGIV